MVDPKLFSVLSAWQYKRDSSIQIKSDFCRAKYLTSSAWQYKRDSSIQIKSDFCRAKYLTSSAWQYKRDSSIQIKSDFCRAKYLTSALGSTIAILLLFHVTASYHIMLDSTQSFNGKCEVYASNEDIVDNIQNF